jgi:hypothetical protein
MLVLMERSEIGFYASQKLTPCHVVKSSDTYRFSQTGNGSNNRLKAEGYHFCILKQGFPQVARPSNTNDQGNRAGKSDKEVSAEVQQVPSDGLSGSVL